MNKKIIFNEKTDEEIEECSIKIIKLLEEFNLVEKYNIICLLQRFCLNCIEEERGILVEDRTIIFGVEEDDAEVKQ